MSRRLVATTVVGGILLAAMPTSYADGPEVPRAVCTKRVNDDENDAKTDFSPVSSTKLQPQDSIPAVDIKNVDLRLTDTKLEVYLHLKNLAKPAEMGQTDAEYLYQVTFTANAHNFTFGYYEYNTGAPFSSLNLPKTDGDKRADSGTGGPNMFTGYTADLRDDLDYIIWTVDRSQVERNLGGEPLVEGDQFTAIAGHTQVRTGSLREADVTTTTGDNATYTVGNDYCFGPPPAVLSNLKTPSVQYSDSVKLSVTLASEGGTALADQPVEFVGAGEPATIPATTNGDGVATGTFKPTQGAGKYAVTAVFAGDATNGKTKLPGEITVSIESTTLGTPTVSKPSATSRVVTATLLDNDKSPVAGQKIAWYVNNKKVSTLTTDGKGKSVFKGAKPGQTVQAKFTTVTGKYSGSSSKAVKA
jgi:hypothetical protein